MSYIESIREDGKRQRTYELPPNCSCRSFTVRELDGNDDLTIAAWVDARKLGDSDNVVTHFEAKRQEALRAALVDIDGREVGQHGVPPTIESWNQRTMVALAKAFDALNALDADEIKKFLAPAPAAPAGAPRNLASVRSTGESSAG